MNILFVCLANLQRSPTAEKLLKERTGKYINVKSAGVALNAATKLDEDVLHWADHVYVMSDEIKQDIISDFPEESEKKRIKVLNIKDVYPREDPELKKRLLEEFYKDKILSQLVEDDRANR